MCSDNAAYVKHGLYINGIIIAETERMKNSERQATASDAASAREYVRSTCLS
jgi:hypothetical protein